MTLEKILDKTLSFIFSPLSIVGVKKCSKCTVRVRSAQIGLLVSAPVRIVPAVRRARARWEIAAKPEKFALRKVRLPYDPEYLDEVLTLYLRKRKSRASNSKS